jgi:hypothetical protein
MKPSMMMLRLFLAAALLPAPLLLAHHSAAAEFDTSRPVVLNGKVTKVAWMNPHVFLWVDVMDASGKVTNWELESAAPNYLLRLGWSKHSIKAGDAVTIRAYPAKDQSNMAKTDAITMPDGRVVTTGRAEDIRDGSSR